MTSPWQKSVDVTLKSVNPVTFDIKPTGSDPLPTQNGFLIFDNDHHNGFDIKFNFIDQTKSGYLWPPNKRKHEAVWSKLGTVCPTSACADVFHATGVDQSCKVLTVNNPNPNPSQGAFQYTLRVTKDGGTNYLPLDPGGVNNNGPTSLWYTSTAFVVAVAAVAIIAIALYAFHVFR